MISVCAEMFYGDTEFCGRLEKLKNDGAEAIEFWRWANKDIEGIKDAEKRLKLKIAGFCVDSEDEELARHISRDILILGMKEELRKALKETKAVYDKLGAEFVIMTLGDAVEGIPRTEQKKNIRECLESVKPYLEESGMCLLLEPINRGERPNYIMPEVTEVLKLIKELDSPKIKLLYDIYHQGMTGDLDAEEIVDNIECIGHFHAADVPDRHEPGTGKIDYEYIFGKIKKTSYSGYFGYEFIPTENFRYDFKTVLE